MRDAKTAAPGFTPYAIYSSPETRFNYSIWDGLEYYTFAHVPMPSGIALDATTLYVASHADGCVYALSRASGVLMQLIQAAPPQSLLGLALRPVASGASSQNGTLHLIASDGPPHHLAQAPA